MTEWKSFAMWWFIGWNIFSCIAYFVGCVAIEISKAAPK